MDSSSIRKNIRSREAAESLHKTIGELLADEVPKLPDDRSRELFWRMLRESIEKNSPSSQKVKVVPQPVPFPGKCSACDGTGIVIVPGISGGDNHLPCKKCNGDGKGFLNVASDINDEIQQLADEVDWPDAPDVAAKAQDIIDSAEEVGRVTDGQMQALENMLRGMQAWVRD